MAEPADHARELLQHVVARGARIQHTRGTLFPAERCTCIYCAMCNGAPTASCEHCGTVVACTMANSLHNGVSFLTGEPFLRPSLWLAKFLFLTTCSETLSLACCCLLPLQLGLVTMPLRRGGRPASGGKSGSGPRRGGGTGAATGMPRHPCCSSKGLVPGVRPSLLSDDGTRLARCLDRVHC